jgi:hypothetical protein
MVQGFFSSAGLSSNANFGLVAVTSGGSVTRPAKKTSTHFLAEHCPSEQSWVKAEQSALEVEGGASLVTINWPLTGDGGGFKK